MVSEKAEVVVSLVVLVIRKAPLPAPVTTFATICASVQDTIWFAGVITKLAPPVFASGNSSFAEPLKLGPKLLPLMVTVLGTSVPAVVGLGEMEVITGAARLSLLP